MKLRNSHFKWGMSIWQVFLIIEKPCDTLNEVWWWAAKRTNKKQQWKKKKRRVNNQEKLQIVSKNVFLLHVSINQSQLSFILLTQTQWLSYSKTIQTNNSCVLIQSNRCFYWFGFFFGQIYGYVDIFRSQWKNIACIYLNAVYALVEPVSMDCFLFSFFWKSSACVLCQVNY